MNLSDIVIFSGRAGENLTKEVCLYLKLEPGKAKIQSFNDGEVDVQLLESVRGKDVFIINPTNPPAENILETVFLAETARGSSAKSVTLVCPYLGYNRQDRKDKPRVPISARIITRFLSKSGADRVVLFDLHSEPTMGFFDSHIVVDHLYASAISIPYIKKRLGDDFIVASPDKGGGPRADGYAKRLGLNDYVLFAKMRPKAGEIAKDKIKIIGDVDGKDVLFVDDMIDTGGTMIADAEVAKKAGARDIYVFATHGIFSKEAIKKFDESSIKEVITTNSIYHHPDFYKSKRVKITVLSVGPLLGEAIKHVHDGRSMSSLII